MSLLVFLVAIGLTTPPPIGLTAQNCAPLHEIFAARSIETACVDVDPTEQSVAATIENNLMAERINENEKLRRINLQIAASNARIDALLAELKARREQRAQPQHD